MSRARFERYKAQQEASQRNGKFAGQEKVVTLPRREREETEVRQAVEHQVDVDGEQRVKEYAAGNTEITKGLLDIVRVDSNFDPTTFCRAPRRPTKSSSLPSPRATAGPSRISWARRSTKASKCDHRSREPGRTDRSEFRRHQVGRSGGGRTQGRHRALTVKFVSELISATRDKAGEVIQAIPSVSGK